MRNHRAFLFLLITIATRCFAWGPEGHRIVAELAEMRLTSAARLQLKQLLGNDDLAAVANWADEIKSERPETSGWHFVDIPMNANGFSEARDCYRPDTHHPQSEQDHHNCVVDRISIFDRVLADRNAPRQERAEALKFLVHFLGDIHQPLHAIAEARGGNEIHVTEFGSSQCGTRPCNLHFAWDIGLIEHSGRRESDYAHELEKLIVRENLSARAGGNPETWANESFRIAKQVWINDGGAIDESYYRKNIPALDERLALAGLRLASMLNRDFGQSK